MLENDLTLNRNAKTLLSIRKGEWSLEKIENIFNEKQLEIEKLVLTSGLQAKPDEGKIKSLLLECLELQFGKIGDKIIIEDNIASILKQINTLSGDALGKYKC